MGDDCELLLDYDCCPWCGEGTVTAANPICTKCNAMVDIEKDGDRGANRIPTKQKQNMHALWDQLLGEDFALRTMRRRYAEIVTNDELRKVGESAVSIGLDPQVWLEESRQLASEHVYTPMVLEQLTRVSRGLVEKPKVLDLPEDYLKNAGRIAQVRATEAGFRLAGVWKECLGGE